MKTTASFAITRFPRATARQVKRSARIIILPVVLLLSTFNFQPSTCFAQGSLTPPGAPGPTFKTLQQIEPRIDLDNAPASAVTTTDANYHFIINQPGSYYLSANLGVTKPNGIQINAEGVTLDLNGFQISRSSGSGDGIEIAAGSHRASVRNGSIKGFVNGINTLTTGGAGGFTRGCAFRDLAVSGCTSTGIFAGQGAVLESCRAHDNSGTYGILAYTGSSLTNCTANNNTAAYGIFANTGSSLTNCTASNNTATYGIFASTGSSLTNCTAYNNQSGASTSAGIGTGLGCIVTHSTAYANFSSAALTSTTGMGIKTGSDSTVSNCTVQGNTGDGIQMGDRCQVAGCNSNGNGNGTSGSGIVGGIRAVVRHCSASDNQKSGIVVLGGSIVSESYVGANGRGGAAAGIDSSGGGGSRIEANVARTNTGIGILGATSDIIIRNFSSVNTTNYNPSSGANFGPLESPSTSTHPTANF